jgi:hypothetical protein
VPEQNPAGDNVRIFQPQPRGTQPMEIGDIVFNRADCQNAHMLRVDGNLGQLVCEGDHVNPGTFVWLDLDAKTVTGSVKLGVFPDGLALVKTP